MKRCLDERALVRVSMHEGTGSDHLHLRLCADCSARYDLLLEDLERIVGVLETDPPPSASAARQRTMWQVQWLSAATACLVLVVLALDVAWVRRSAPVQVAAQTSSVSAFAADLSAALFTTTDASTEEVEAQYLEAALDAGQPCSQSRFLAGERNDQLSAFAAEGE